MSPRGGGPTHDTVAHENNYRQPGRRAHRDRQLEAREPRRQAAFAARVFAWDPGAA